MGQPDDAVPAVIDAGDVPEDRNLAAAEAAASRGLAIAESMQFGTAVWRLRMIGAIARGEPTDDAAAEFTELANRIPERELRAHFERQSLAPR